VVWAAHHDRREVWVGLPTVIAILGNKLAPSLADWYLARNGYSAQQTDESADPSRPDNLWHPVPGDHGAHGAFDARALAQPPGLGDRAPQVAAARRCRRTAARPAAGGQTSASPVCCRREARRQVGRPRGYRQEQRDIVGFRAV
jgi:hypothetical protein